ncbi:hypothetical protein SLA2020_149670 [Shorea laevis]
MRNFPSSILWSKPLIYPNPVPSPLAAEALALHMAVKCVHWVMVLRAPFSYLTARKLIQIINKEKGVPLQIAPIMDSIYLAVAPSF